MQQPSAVRCAILVWALPFGLTVEVKAQQPKCDDQTIEQMRSLQTISSGDQDRIVVWIRCEVERLVADVAKAPFEAYNQFVAKLEGQFNNPANSQTFKTQFAAQTAVVAASELPKSELPPLAGAGIARVLVTVEGIETLPGLLAGLKSKTPAVRFLAGRGLSALRGVLARDKAQLAQAVSAIQTAGVAETDSVVVSHIYRALAYPPAAVSDVFAAYVAILDARLAARRIRLANDGGEIEALEFFRTEGVIAALNSDQKAQLSQRLAVFLRLDAERLAAPAISAQELLWIERSLEAEEAILATIVGKPPIIAVELANGGVGRREAILESVMKWIGDAAANQPGLLNTPPLNVPIGAP